MIIFYFKDGHYFATNAGDHDTAWKLTGLSGGKYQDVMFYTTSDTRLDYRFDEVSKSWQPSEAYMKAIPAV